MPESGDLFQNYPNAIPSPDEESRSVYRVTGEKTKLQMEELAKEKELLAARNTELAVSDSALQAEEAALEALATELESQLSSEESEQRAEELAQEAEAVTESQQSNVGEALSKKAEVMNKAKKHKILKVVLGSAIGVAILGLLGTGIFSAFAPKNWRNSDTKPTETESPQIINVGIGQTESTESIETKNGIKDGYGSPGLWLSNYKDHDYDYGDAREVGKICENDEVEMLKYVADNQVESLADYMAEFPEDLCPDGFYGLTPREIEAKLESLSPDEYEKIKTQALQVIDSALTRTAVTAHDYHHYGMELKDKNGNVVHENMQMTDKGIGPGIEVVEFYWIGEEGSGELGSMLVNIRRQYDSEKNIAGYEGGLEVLRRGRGGSSTETSTPTKAPTTTPSPNRGKEGDPHGGDLVTPSDPVNPASEVSQEQNDKTNQGDQGYRDDNRAKPGDSSNQNGVNESGFAASGITAQGANTTGGRLAGGENQSTSTMAGENPAQQNNAEGQRIDENATETQRNAQEQNALGGNNNSGAAEESRVAGGNF